MKQLVTILAIISISTLQSFACTTAIISSGKATPDGLPNAESYRIVKLKEQCFPIASWAEGENYVLLNKLVNKEETGLIQFTSIFDKETIARTKMLYNKWVKFKFNPTKTSNLYLTLNRDVKQFYGSTTNLMITCN